MPMKVLDYLASCNSSYEGGTCFYVAIPVYKTELYLPECIESILNQTYGNWRAVIVDDGSPDRCGSICDEFASRDRRIAVIHKENAGLLSARRAAVDYILEHNDGGYLVFLDSDDALELSAFETINKLIEETGVDLLMYQWRVFASSSTLELINNDNISFEIISDKRSLYNKVFNDHGYNSLCKKAVNISILKKKDYTCFYHVKHGEDLLQSLDMFRAAKSVCFSNAVLYRYRMNPSSITHAIAFDTYKVDTTLFRAVLAFLQEENVWDAHDYAAYMGFCKHLLHVELRMISSFNTSRDNKIGLFEKILDDSYYQYVLSHTKAKDRMLLALKRRHFGMVFFFCRCYKIGSKVKKALRLHKSEC